MYIIEENKEILTEEQWHAERKKHIGGSECAAIIGKSPYMTNVELWEIKTGKRKPTDISGKSYVQYGINAEEPMRQLFALDNPQYDVIYKPYDIRISKKYSFLSASIDGELIEIETQRKGTYEGKSAIVRNSEELKKWLDGEIPMHYFSQCLHNMFSSEHEFSVLNVKLMPIWYENQSILKNYKIERSEVQSSEDYLISAEVKWWSDYVLTNTCPALLLPSL